MSSGIDAQSPKATPDALKSARATVAMDSGPVQSYINRSFLNPGRASTWPWLNPYLDFDSEDIPEQAMDAFRIVSEDLGPAGRWIVEAVLRPLSDQIWKKLHHYDQYCMTKREIQVFAFFELEYPENRREFIKAAKRRSWQEICRSALDSCSPERTPSQY